MIRIKTIYKVMAYFEDGTECLGECDMLEECYLLIRAFEENLKKANATPPAEYEIKNIVRVS